jgi:flagellar biosynthesis GTPase FlhF
MKLQRILARDSRAANEKAIKLYGKDVLIISSQRVDNQIELIVALDLEPTAAAPAVAAESSQVSRPMRDESPEAFVPFAKLFHDASDFASMASDERPLAAYRTVPLVAVPAAALPPNVDRSHQQAVHDQIGLTDAQQLRHESQRSREVVELLRSEIAALRKEFSLSRQMMPWQDGLRLSPAIQQLTMAMIEVGMPAGLRALLTDSIQEFDSVEQALPVMQSLLINALSRSFLAVPEGGAHALCGPSGSGKTLMVGRLAYAGARAHGADSQVMVSFADQRPGAWAQMQVLAAQSGVNCFRATNSEMLRTLLQDLEGKTLWIDTSGTDYVAQAELLLSQHPKVMRHAVLPLDATVTNVQKILQNSSLSWSSLMLTKMDEASYPWALIKGLSEPCCAVSCMSGSDRIDQPAEPFDAARLVHLALSPLLSFTSGAVGGGEMMSTVSATSEKTRFSTFKPTLVSSVAVDAENRDLTSSKISKIMVSDSIDTPTLTGNLEAISIQINAPNTSSGKKILNG